MRRITLMLVVALSGFLGISTASAATQAKQLSAKLVVTSDFPLNGNDVYFYIQYTRGNAVKGFPDPIGNSRDGVAKTLPAKLRAGDVVTVWRTTSYNGFGPKQQQTHTITKAEVKRGWYTFRFKLPYHAPRPAI